MSSLKQELYNEIRNIVKQENQVLSDKIITLECQLEAVNTTVTNTHTTITNVEKVVGAYLINWGRYRVTYGLDHDKIVLDIAGAVTAISGSTIASTKVVDAFVKAKTKLISKQIIDEVNNLKADEQTKFMKDGTKSLPFILPSEICANIVGESYVKWDSISQYYPTLVFVFNEVTSNNNPRKSQIKLRFNKLSGPITDQDINDIVMRAKDQPKITYLYGCVKGNYVSKDKRFKTTVFKADKQSISELLNSLFKTIPETFDTDLLSITEIGRKRPSLTKRKTDLYNVKLNLTS